MFLFQRIEEVMMSHQDARQAIGQFVLQEQSNLYNYTISEIAKQTFTSNATVVRFAKTLGFDGWKDFMKAFIAEIKYQESHQSDIDVNYPFKGSDMTEDIIEKMKQLQIESIKDTADLMDVDNMNQAVNYLLKAKRIVIFGLSPNIYLGELFRRKLITIGKVVDIARSGETGIISHTLGKDDCAIIISYSGSNNLAEPISNVELLLKNDVPIIGITSGGENYIRKNIDCILTISSKERLYTKISNFATEESISYILNVLFSCYFVRNYNENSLFKIQNSKLLEQQRTAILKEMKDDF